MPDDDLERLIAAHLDDALDAEEAARLHARLRADGEARRLLIAAARQAAVLPRLALEQEPRAGAPSPLIMPAPARPRASWRWPAAAAVFIATVGLGLLLRAPAPPGDLRVDGQAQIESASGGSGGPWLRSGDRIRTATGPATLSWASEATRLELAADSLLTVEAAAGAKRLRLERGALQAEVAHQPAAGGVTIVTPFGRIEVVGTRFAVQVREHGSAVSVERGAVRLVAQEGGATDQPPVLLESGYAATMAGTRISHPVPQAAPTSPGGATAVEDPAATAQVVHLGPADWRGGAGWEGELVDGAIRARLQADSPVTRIITPTRRPDGWLRTAPGLRCTVRLHLDQEATCALLLVCDRPDGSDWLGNFQGERRLPAGDQDLVLGLEDLHPVAGSGLPPPAGSRIVGIAVMSWGPAADLRVRDVELLQSPGK